MVKSLLSEYSLFQLDSRQNATIAICQNRLSNAKKEYGKFKAHYLEYVFLTDRQRDQMALSHAYLQILLPHANSSSMRDIFFNILLNEREEKEFQGERLDLNREEGELVPEFDHILPLSTPDAFRKYIQRAKKKGIIKTLIKERHGKPSNNYQWTEIVKQLVILYAINKATHCSSREISEDIEFLIEDCPDVIKQGVHLVKPSTIRNFLRKNAEAYISYAKDNPNDFKRKILGVLRFIPPSAPLVRVGVDGYTFQVICEDDDTHKPYQLIAEVVYDFKTKAVLGLAFADTESNITFRKAFNDFFKTTGNRLPREIVMDRFSAHTCRRLENFNDILKKSHVDITRSSNPNNNAPLERFFNTLQQVYQGSVLKFSYIGSSITSRAKNARPSKRFAMKLRKKEFLKSRSEIIHQLTYLIKEEYNKKYVVHKALTPMQLFEKQKSNPATTLTAEQVAYMTLEKHQNIILGCGVFIKKGDHIYLYKKRTLEVATKYYRAEVNTYINDDFPVSPAYIFQHDTAKFLFKMENLSIVPSSLFDRTEEQKTLIKNYNKETRELIAEISREIVNMETNIEILLGGKNFREHTKAAAIKKQADNAFLQHQIGMTEKKPEPQIPFTNALKGFGKKKMNRVTGEEQLVLKYGL